MMNAEQMFEELNLEQIRNDDNYIEYVRNGLGGYISILFSLRWKSIKSTYGYQARGTNYHEISPDELKAIIQQAKELGWLEEKDENFEEKQETNYEHFKDEFIEIIKSHLALVNGEPRNCSRINCSYCDFNRHGGCDKKAGEVEEWLNQPHKKPLYKLRQFEYDLINAYDRCKECCLLNEIEALKRMSEKGYFKGIDPFTKVHEILDNCEVIK